MFCPRCGTQLPDGSKFCATCGTKTENQAAPAAQPNTGFTPNQNFTGGASASVIPGASAFALPPFLQQVKAKELLILRVLAIALAVFMLLGWVGLNSDLSSQSGLSSSEKIPAFAINPITYPLINDSLGSFSQFSDLLDELDIPGTSNMDSMMSVITPIIKNAGMFLTLGYLSWALAVIALILFLATSFRDKKSSTVLGFIMFGFVIFSVLMSFLLCGSLNDAALMNVFAVQPWAWIALVVSILGCGMVFLNARYN